MWVCAGVVLCMCAEVSRASWVGDEAVAGCSSSQTVVLWRLGRVVGCCGAVELVLSWFTLDKVLSFSWD